MPARGSGGFGPWVPLGGATRQYRNIETGQTISRRQFDRVYGLLSRQGWTSYERKAAAAPPELRQARPARGRASRHGFRSSPNLARVEPLQGHIARNISVPLTIEAYDRAVSSIIRNKRVQFAAMGTQLDLGGGPGFRWYYTTSIHKAMTFPNQLPSGEEALDWAYDLDYGEPVAFVFHLHFHSEHFKEKSAKTRKRNRRKHR